MKKIVARVFIFSISFILVLFIASAAAAPDESSDCNSCHDEGDYEISADKTTISTQTSTKITITIEASGDDLVVEAPEDARDNDQFDFDEELIEDNDGNDDDGDNDEIKVEFEITAPSKEGDYTLLIMSRESEESGRDTPLAYVEIEVKVGSKTPLEMFFDHKDYYLGGFALIFMFTGLFVFQIDVKRKNKKLSEGRGDRVQAFEEEESPDIEREKDIGLFKDKIKTHGFFIAIAMILITVNIFLIMNDTMGFTFGLVDSMISMESMEMSDLAYYLQDLNQLIHITMGTIGYIAGIIVVVGIFTKVPVEKLKLPKYIMCLGWTFNFLYGIFINSTILII